MGAESKIASSISEREYGQLETTVKHLEDQLKEMNGELALLRKDIAAISTTLSEARGGWKTLMLVGGAASSLGATFGALVHSYWPK